MDKAKPFDIPKREVWEAFKKVKANQGAAGVDGQSILDFEADLTNNLYELWNRLSSGSYFPPPVRRVDIPKVDGGTRHVEVGRCPWTERRRSGTRETDLLAPENTVQAIDALVLSGGSAFGLDAAAGVHARLRGQDLTS